MSSDKSTWSVWARILWAAANVANELGLYESTEVESGTIVDPRTQISVLLHQVQLVKRFDEGLCLVSFNSIKDRLGAIAL